VNTQDLTAVRYMLKGILFELRKVSLELYKKVKKGKMKKNKRDKRL
jgi:hypothetical protein